MSNDLISRKALKEHKFPIPIVGDYQQGWNDAIDAIIDNAPTVSHGEWIPVSERLPEEGKSVLVCIKTQGGISQYVSERFHGDRWSALGGRTPIAWMPLPEPYKETENE